jgi:uncharacterized protein YvpB
MFIQDIDFDIIFLVFLLLMAAVVAVDLVFIVRRFRIYLRRRKGSQHKLQIASINTDGSVKEIETDSSATPKPAEKEIVKTKKLHPALAFVWRYRLIWINIVFPLLAFGLLYLAWSPEPRIVSSDPAPEANWSNYDQPVTLTFNNPVLISRLRPFISREEVSGTWVYEPYMGFLPFTRKAKFYPKTTALPNQRFVIYMTGVARPFVDESHEHALNFYTPKPLEVFATTPLNNATELGTDTHIELTFTQDQGKEAELEYKIEPEIELNFEKTDARHVKITPKEPLEQSQTYKLTVSRVDTTYDTETGEILSRENPLVIHELTFSTVKAPLIQQFMPTGTGVRENTAIKIVFELPMKRETVDPNLRFAPVFDFDSTWDNDRILTIYPKNGLAKETEYVFTLPPGIESTTGGKSETEVRYTFTTIGAVRVSKFTPASGLSRLPRTTNVIVEFDQEVDHDSAQSHFSISPNVPGRFSWTNNTMTFILNTPLNFQTTYTAKVSPGVKTVYGLDSRDTFSTSFTTVPNVTIISGFGPGNFDHQDYDMTCAVASFKMLLAWKGIYRSEDSLISQIGHQPDQYIYDSSIGAYRWGNPNVGFVGSNIAGGGGTDPNRAFGVYWDPIIRVWKNNYGTNTKLYTHWNAAGLASEIEAGHPVQIWWWNGLSWTEGDVGGKRMDWYTSVATGSQKIYAINGMHSVDVVGFAGDASNPTGFYILDPWFGWYLKPVGAFLNQWKYYNNTGVAVY